MNSAVSLTALAADRHSGEGVLVQVEVLLSPDSAITGPEGARPDTRWAMRRALRAALPPQTGARWSVNVAADAVEGESLGLAAAAAALLARGELKLPPSLAFTGAVGPQGEVTRVGALAAQLAAARAAGLSQVALPRELGASADEGPSLTPVSSLTELRRLFPPSRTPWVRVAACGVVPLLFALLHIGDALDVRLQYALLSAVRGPIADHSTAVLAYPAPAGQQNPLELRREYPELIRELVKRKVKSITFDIAFSTSRPETDLDFARAISEAEAARVPVIAGVRWLTDSQRPVPPGSEALEAGAENLLGPAFHHLGHVRVETESLLRPIPGRAPARLIDAEGGELWALAITTLAARESAEIAPRLDGDTLIVGSREVPAAHERVTLAPVARSAPLDARDPGSWPDDMSVRSIFVGILDDEDLWVFPGGDRYGVTLHADLFETIWQGAAPLNRSTLASALLTLLCWAGTTAAGALLPKRLFPVAAVVPLAAMAFVMASLPALYAVVPLLLAAAGGMMAGWWARR